MAYNASKTYSGNQNRTPAATSTKAVAPTMKSASGAKVEDIFRTGLWAQEGGKSLATVQVRQDITIPAGSYINLYQTDAEHKTEKSPDFKITVRPGVLKEQA